MTNKNVTSSCANWIKDLLVYTSIGHNYAVFTVDGEYGWEDEITMSSLKEIVDRHESLIIYNKELSSFTKYDK